MNGSVPSILRSPHLSFVVRRSSVLSLASVGPSRSHLSPSSLQIPPSQLVEEKGGNLAGTFPDLCATPLDNLRRENENGGGSADPPSHIPAPSHRLPPPLVRSVLGFDQSWLVSVERDNMGREEGEVSISLRRTFSAILKASALA
ncbi:hypothetical protein K523DRAFT_358970 [Schizophyllum commune Tattone D]|nr:hypothetical protein K523DRAFT_358970 [Schizophyllum commune Tattone D]